MTEIKNEIIVIINLFNLGTYQGSRTIDNNFVGKYTKSKFWTEKGEYTHYFKNKKIN